MRVPNGHVHIGGLISVQVEIQDFICIYFSELNEGFSFDHCKAFDLPGMEMVSSCDAGNGSRERALPADSQTNHFHKSSAEVSMLGEFYRIMVFDVEITTEGVEQVVVKL